MSSATGSDDSGESHQLLKDPDHFVHNDKGLFDSLDEKLQLLLPAWTRQTPIANVLQNPTSYIVPIILFLLPSFVVDPIRNYRKPSPRPQLSSTAWLDGLRGLAALTVYVFHWVMAWFGDFLGGPYGAPGSANNFFQLPIIRTLISGPAAVAIFFVISGYVITIKPLTMIYNHNKAGPQSTDRVLSTLCGGLFRRPFRLFLPALISTFIAAVINQPTGFLVHIPRLPDLQSQVADWFRASLHMMNILNIHRHKYIGSELPAYNGHLWTIPIEFKNSILVFLLILAFARVKRWVHLMGVVGFAWIQLASQGDTDAAAFCWGLILAEMTLIFPPPSSRVTSASKPGLSLTNGHKDTYLPPYMRHWMWHFITITFGLYGLVLLGYPFVEDVHAIGFHWITEWTPAPFRPGAANSVGSGLHIWSIFCGATMYITACTYSAPLPLPRISRWFNDFRRTSPQQIYRDKSTDSLESLVPSADDSTTHPTPFLQIPHTTRFAQYLGWVSYSMYLLHDYMIVGYGNTYYFVRAEVVYKSAVEATLQLQAVGQDAAAEEVRRAAWDEYFSTFLWSSLLQTIFLFWISDVFTRVIDLNTVRVTRWLWGAIQIK